MLLQPYRQDKSFPKTALLSTSSHLCNLQSPSLMPHPTTINPPSLPPAPAFALRASKSFGWRRGRGSTAPLTATRSAAVLSKYRRPCSSSSSIPFTKTSIEEHRMYTGWWVTKLDASWQHATVDGSEGCRTNPSRGLGAEWAGLSTSRFYDGFSLGEKMSYNALNEHMQARNSACYWIVREKANIISQQVAPLPLAVVCSLIMYGNQALVGFSSRSRAMVVFSCRNQFIAEFSYANKRARVTPRTA